MNTLCEGVEEGGGDGSEGVEEGVDDGSEGVEEEWMMVVRVWRREGVEEGVDDGRRVWRREEVMGVRVWRKEGVEEGGGDGSKGVMKHIQLMYSSTDILLMASHLTPSHPHTLT